MKEVSQQATACKDAVELRLKLPSCFSTRDPGPHCRLFAGHWRESGYCSGGGTKCGIREKTRGIWGLYSQYFGHVSGIGESRGFPSDSPASQSVGQTEGYSILDVFRSYFLVVNLFSIVCSVLVLPFLAYHCFSAFLFFFLCFSLLLCESCFFPLLLFVHVFFAWLFFPSVSAGPDAPNSSWYLKTLGI